MIFVRAKIHFHLNNENNMLKRKLRMVIAKFKKYFIPKARKVVGLMNGGGGT